MIRTPPRRIVLQQHNLCSTPRPRGPQRVRRRDDGLKKRARSTPPAPPPTPPQPGGRADDVAVGEVLSGVLVVSWLAHVIRVRTSAPDSSAPVRVAVHRAAPTLFSPFPSERRLPRCCCSGLVGTCENLRSSAPVFAGGAGNRRKLFRIFSFAHLRARAGPFPRPGGPARLRVRVTPGRAPCLDAPHSG